MKVCRDCINLIREMQAYKYKKRRYTILRTLDHEADKWRYFIMGYDK